MDDGKAAVVLVIDDEASIRLGIVVAIRRHGLQVIEAVDGRDGLQKAKQYLPDLIISDVMMPPPDGFELKHLLDADPATASIPFIFLTARSGKEDRIAGIRDGADDYIAKPFGMEELLARVDALLRRVQTERQHGRDQMAEIARQDMDKLRAEILQNFHHELRTPLMNIVTPLELAVNNKFDDPVLQSNFLRTALSNVDRLESLVSDIIILSNIDQGNLNSIRQPIDLNVHLLNPIYKRLERYKAKELNFTHQIIDEGEIKAARREFTQSVLHIVDNAFKFSPQNGHVNLTIDASTNGGVKITVSDDGPGIPLELREKVFEKFYQISQGDTRQHDGLGVGLTIARAIFRHSGGDVTITDSPKGCLVLAELPDIRPEDIVYG
ncbi:MAG: hybrid sensor histidine kinase/response regulator [Chloroflexi bacterium]|nr:hybrid sensor histidine kinase/response regulator [Chloroflexota bacterium]